MLINSLGPGLPDSFAEVWFLMDTPESEEKFMVQIPSAALRKHATRVQTLRTEEHTSNKSGQISLTGPGHVLLLLLIMIYLEKVT